MNKGKFVDTVPAISAMKRNRAGHSRSLSTAACTVGLVGLLVALGDSTAARAQTGIDPLNGMLAPLDAYGNVQAFRPERRALDIYQNDYQRQALTSYLNVNRQFGQRGSERPFALPGDLLSATVNSYTGAIFLQNPARRIPAMAGVSERERLQAFTRYGGFGDRHNYYRKGDPSGLFARRRQLIMATGLNAPIERALGIGGRLPGLHHSVSRTPFLESDVAASQAENNGESDTKVTLDERLSTRADVLHAQSRSDAWSYFRDGHFRRAMRLFETAAMMEPEDYESWIGEVFCHVAIGSLRTAFVLLIELDRRDPNVYAHPLNVFDRFGNVIAAQRVRLSAQDIADSAEQPAEAKALHIFVLWYMDRRDDALRAARALAVQAPGRTWSAWPDKMRAASPITPPGSH